MATSLTQAQGEAPTQGNKVKRDGTEHLTSSFSLSICMGPNASPTYMPCIHTLKIIVTSKPNPCLHWISNAVIKHHHQKQLGKEGAYSILQLQPATEESRRDRSGRGGRADAEVTDGLCSRLSLLACSACILTEPRAI